MKKLFVFIFVSIFVLFSGCSNNVSNKSTATTIKGTSAVTSTSASKTVVRFESGDFSYFIKNWETSTFGVIPFKGIKIEKVQKIIDMKSALEINEYIKNQLEVKGYQVLQYKPIFVDFDEKYKIWIVCNQIPIFGPDKMYLGNTFSIALNQSDSKIIRLWFDE